MMVNKSQWSALSEVAWKKREFARANTKVGAAVLSDSGNIYGGCNVEHRFRSHDIHAETNVLSTMVASGDNPKAILIVAEREKFTPCGSCMDWIFELGGKKCLVGFQNKPNGRIKVMTANELMPHYPR